MAEHGKHREHLRRLAQAAEPGTGSCPHCRAIVEALKSAINADSVAVQALEEIATMHNRGGQHARKVLAMISGAKASGPPLSSD